MGVKVFPRSDIYRKHFDEIKWDKDFKPNDKSDLAEKTSVNYFEASREDIEELNRKIGERQDYIERVKAKYAGC